MNTRKKKASRALEPIPLRSVDLTSLEMAGEWGSFSEKTDLFVSAFPTSRSVDFASGWGADRTTSKYIRKASPAAKKQKGKPDAVRSVSEHSLFLIILLKMSERKLLKRDRLM